MNDITYEQAVDFFGTPASLARALGLKPQAVYQWGGVIPPLRRYQIRDLMNAGASDQAPTSVKGAA